MKNADLFKQIFNIYATELWSMPEAEFLEWLNKNAVPATPIPKEATNGDMIKAIFPNCVINTNSCGSITNIDGKMYWSKKWWNAPYKTKSEG